MRSEVINLDDLLVQFTHEKHDFFKVIKTTKRGNDYICYLRTENVKETIKMLLDVEVLLTIDEVVKLTVNNNKITNIEFKDEIKYKHFISKEFTDELIPEDKQLLRQIKPAVKDSISQQIIEKHSFKENGQIEIVN